MSVVSTMNSKRATDEVRHANDELEYFYMEAKRNKKLAGWAAKQLGADKKEYFLELISADITTAGPKPVIDRMVKDFKQADLDIKEEDIWSKLRDVEREVLHDMMQEKEKRCLEEVKAKAKKKEKKKEKDKKKDKKKKKK